MLPLLECINIYYILHFQFQSDDIMNSENGLLIEYIVETKGNFSNRLNLIVS